MISRSQYQHDRNRASCMTYLSLFKSLLLVGKERDVSQVEKEILEINHIRSLSQTLTLLL